MTDMVEIKLDHAHHRAAAEKAWGDLISWSITMQIPKAPGDTESAEQKTIKINEMLQGRSTRRCICCGAPAHLVAHD